MERIPAGWAFQPARFLSPLSIRIRTVPTYFHLAAYRGSVGAGLSDVDIAAVQDNQLTIANNHFVLPEKMRLAFAAGFGTNLSRLLLNTPKMRYVGLPSLVPINITATVPSPPNLVDLTDKNMWVDKVDEIAVQASSTDAGAQTMTAIMAFQPAFKQPQQLQVWRIRATAAITAVAGSWTAGSMTLQQTIPRGTYAVIGMDIVGTNLLAGRLSFAGGSWRPGVIARNAVGSVPHPMMQSLAMGVFGEFDSINLPVLEILSGGANTSQEIFLDLQQLTGAPQINYGS